MPTLPRAGELADSLQIPADETVKRARQVDRTGQRLASRALAGVFQRVMCCTATQERRATTLWRVAPGQNQPAMNSW